MNKETIRLQEYCSSIAPWVSFIAGCFIAWSLIVTLPAEERELPFYKAAVPASEVGEKYEFVSCYYNYGPTALDVVVGVSTFSARLISIPASSTSMTIVMLTEPLGLGLSKISKLELFVGLYIYLNGYWFMLLGFLLYRFLPLMPFRSRPPLTSIFRV